MRLVKSELMRRAFTPNERRPKPLVLGIDPGLSGAVAVVDIDANSIIDMIDMPTFQKETKSRKSGHFNMVDPHQLSSLIDSYAPYTSLAILEEPNALPGQGLSSTFRFGHVCGLIHGVMAGHYIPTAPVKPAVWKGALGLSHDKETSLALANQIYPGFSYLWKMKKHHDRAEAALMVQYGIKYLKGLIEFSRKG